MERIGFKITLQSHERPYDGPRLVSLISVNPAIDRFQIYFKTSANNLVRSFGSIDEQ